MAEGYTVQAAIASVEITSGDQGQDVQQLTMQAVPSGVVFPVRVPLASFSPQAVDAVAAPLAAALNALADDPGVVSLSTVQDVNAAGQLEDRLQVTATTASGKLSTLVDVPLSDVLRGGVDAKVAAAVSNLEAVEKL